VCLQRDKLKMNGKPKKERKLEKREKRTARVVFANGAEFRATTNEFWDYVKRGFIKRVSEKPLAGKVVKESEFRLILVGHTVLSSDARTHLTEMMRAKNFRRHKGF